MAVGGVTFKSDDIVIKSPNDCRLYRYIQLENGLCALIVHDPEIYPDGALEPSKAPANTKKKKEEEKPMTRKRRRKAISEDDETKKKRMRRVKMMKLKGKRRERKMPLRQEAAAMCVGMGSFADPSEAQGLAHFLEEIDLQGLRQEDSFECVNPFLFALADSKAAWVEDVESLLL
ncbi:Nardilysin-like [Vitis vinifera]|uniref:Nardilysin-like n=1 Tax=Vitis vinifera TaxID=29760 RepID=A0A438KP84_VITVI|nr:Nardilysin-like [Vitis vinifera]